MPETLKDPDTIITLAEAGSLLGVSRKRVSQLILDGFIPRSGRGKTTVKGAVQGYARFWREKASTDQPSTAHDRLQVARASLIEHRVAEMAANLIPIEEVLWVGDLHHKAFHDAFEKLRQLAVIPPDQHNRWNGLIDKALSDLGKTHALFVDVIRNGKDVELLHALHE